MQRMNGFIKPKFLILLTYNDKIRVLSYEKTINQHSTSVFSCDFFQYVVVLYFGFASYSMCSCLIALRIDI